MKGIKDEMKKIRISIQYWEEIRTQLITRLSLVDERLAVLKGKKQRHQEHYKSRASINIKKD